MGRLQAFCTPDATRMCSENAIRMSRADESIETHSQRHRGAMMSGSAPFDAASSTSTPLSKYFRILFERLRYFATGSVLTCRAWLPERGTSRSSHSKEATMLKLVSAATLVAISAVPILLGVPTARQTSQAGEATRTTINPTEMMKRAPSDLPVERSDAI